MNNYPAGITDRDFDIQDIEDLCPECESGVLEQLYFYKHGKRQEMTNSFECNECGAVIDDNVTGRENPCNGCGEDHDPGDCFNGFNQPV